MSTFKKFKKINGWLDYNSGLIIQSLLQSQNEAGFEGGVAEIGVHHGKLFSILLNDSKNSNISLAMDVFEDQHLNVDASGKGNKDIFLHNMEKYVGSTDLMEVLKIDSLEINAEELTKKYGYIRFFSVDGGHTSKHALNDLMVAEKCLCNEGIICIDDVFNENWPDVSVGFYQFIENSQFRPLAISPNKVFLCKKEMVEIYQSHLMNQFPSAYVAQKTWLANDIPIFTSRWGIPLTTRIKRLVEGTFLEKPAHKIKALLFQ